MKSYILLLLVVQLITMLVFMASVFVFHLGDIVSALSGCLASIIPSLYFSYKMSRQANNKNASAWLGYAYRADIGKWVMAGIIFALLFTSGYQWDPLILFVGYLLVQISGIFVPIFEKGN